MIKYRPHRSTLEDAMAEARVFSTVDEMFDYIADQVWNDGNPIYEKCDLVIDDKVTFDARNGWYTQKVCAKVILNERYDTPQCIGMCDLDAYGKPEHHYTITYYTREDERLTHNRETICASHFLDAVKRLEKILLSKFEGVDFASIEQMD